MRLWTRCWAWAMLTAPFKIDIPPYIPGVSEGWTYEVEEKAGQGVDIYIMTDEGVATHLTEFGERASYMPGEVQDHDAELTGTCEASLAAGRTYGVAKKANIIAMRTHDAQDMIDGIYKVIRRHEWWKKRRKQFPKWRGSVILTNQLIGKSPVAESSSLGSSENEDPALGGCIDATKAADEAGIVIIGSSGHVDVDVADYDPYAAPCMCPGVLCVGGVNSKYEKDEDSNYGMPINIWGPGENIECSGPAEGSVMRYSGTTLAAAQVAGIVATILSFGLPDDEVLVDDTFWVKMTLLGNAQLEKLSLPDKHQNRNLLANTGISQRRGKIPFAIIGVPKSLERESQSSFMPITVPPLDARQTVQCYDRRSGATVRKSQANMLWLRLRWELGKVHRVVDAKGRWQKLVPCVDDACVYLKTTGLHPNLDFVFHPRFRFDQYLAHIATTCSERVNGRRIMTGGWMKFTDGTGVIIHLRRDVSIPPSFSRALRDMFRSLLPSWVP